MSGLVKVGPVVDNIGCWFIWVLRTCTNGVSPLRSASKVIPSSWNAVFTWHPQALLPNSRYGMIALALCFQRDDFRITSWVVVSDMWCPHAGLWLHAPLATWHDAQVSSFIRDYLLLFHRIIIYQLIIGIPTYQEVNKTSIGFLKAAQPLQICCWDPVSIDFLEQFVEDPCRNYPVQWNKEKWSLLWVLLGGLKDVICNDLHVLLITAKVENSKYAYF